MKINFIDQTKTKYNSITVGLYIYAQVPKQNEEIYGPCREQKSQIQIKRSFGVLRTI